MNRLLATVSRATAADIEAISDVAERILGHFRR